MFDKNNINQSKLIFFNLSPRKKPIKAIMSIPKEENYRKSDRENLNRMQSLSIDLRNRASCCRLSFIAMRDETNGIQVRVRFTCHVPEGESSDRRRRLVRTLLSIQSSFNTCLIDSKTFSRSFSRSASAFETSLVITSSQSPLATKYRKERVYVRITKSEKYRDLGRKEKNQHFN